MGTAHSPTVVAALALTAALLSACATSEPALPPGSGHITCLDDTPECIGRRQGLVRQLTGDNSRSWLKEPATPEAYASGVRLYAMKNKKKDMSCDELQRAKVETDGAATALRAAGNRLTPAQISRGIMFAGDVGRELSNEMGRRCKKA
jgi:hypothetical protein